MCQEATSSTLNMDTPRVRERSSQQTWRHSINKENEALQYWTVRDTGVKIVKLAFSIEKPVYKKFA